MRGELIKIVLPLTTIALVILGLFFGGAFLVYLSEFLKGIESIGYAAIALAILLIVLVLYFRR